MRNLADLQRGIAEMTRVLRPGGRIVILEITQPQRPPLSWFFSLWFDRLVPLIGTLAGDRDAYSYLPESVRRFPPPRGLADQMDAAGLEGIRWTLLAGGIIAIHSGSKPAGEHRDEPLDRARAGHRGDRPRLGLAARRAWPRSSGASRSGSRGWGDQLESDAGETLAAGGKRMRPLLVLLCAGPGAGRSAIRAATAIELVHMATLVHDDVLDAAPLRRGLPTVVATLGPRAGRGDRGPALLARLRRALPATATASETNRQVELLAHASVALARGELAQRDDCFDTTVDAERYLDRCRLEDRLAVRVRLRDRRRAARPPSTRR